MNDDVRYKPCPSQCLPGGAVRMKAGPAEAALISERNPNCQPVGSSNPIWLASIKSVACCTPTATAIPVFSPTLAK